MNMIRNEVIEKANDCLKDHGFLLIIPDCVDQEYAEGLLCLAGISGCMVLHNIDVFEHTEGYDLLKPDAPFGFNAYIANLCDALLIEAGLDLVPAENVEQ
jgi:hypothetical protein